MPAARAERVIEQIKAERPELDHVPIEIVGDLTRADSEEKTFKLVLDRDLMPEILDKRKRHIEGGYTPTASQQVRESGLWDTRVIATVWAFPVVDPLTGSRHLERFTFRRIRPAP